MQKTTIEADKIYTWLNKTSRVYGSYNLSQINNERIESNLWEFKMANAFWERKYNNEKLHKLHEMDLQLGQASCS